MASELGPVTPETIAEANSCSIKECSAAAEWLPVLVVSCKGKKGRGRHALCIESAMPAPLCSAHRYLPTVSDLLQYISWDKLQAQFAARNWPPPKRSTARLIWQRLINEG